MTIDEVKDMLPQKPERLDTVAEPKRTELVVESAAGNIIVECKAITQLSEREHYQTFGYLRATKFPIAILVNFGTERRAQIERYHYSNGKLYVF